MRPGILSATATRRDTSSNPDLVRLDGEVRSLQRGSIATFISPARESPGPGTLRWTNTDFWSLRAPTYDPQFRNDAIRVGLFWEGDYMLIAWLVDVNTRAELGRDSALFHIRAFYRPEQRTPPDGATVGPFPMLAWTASARFPAAAVTYKVWFWLLQLGLSPEQAARQTPPVHVATVRSATSLRYPMSASALQENMSYVWAVQATEVNGRPLLPGQSWSGYRTFTVSRARGIDTAVICCPGVARTMDMVLDTAAAGDSGLSEEDARRLMDEAVRELVRRMEGSNEEEQSGDIPPEGGGTGTGTIRRQPGSWRNWTASGALELPDGVRVTFSKEQEQEGGKCERSRTTCEANHPGHPEKDHRFEAECTWDGTTMHVVGSLTKNCHTRIVVDMDITSRSLAAVFKVYRGQVDERGVHTYTFVCRMTLRMDGRGNGDFWDADGNRYQVKNGQIMPGERPMRCPWRPPGLK
jgi:hypothetical protein